MRNTALLFYPYPFHRLTPYEKKAYYDVKALEQFLMAIKEQPTARSFKVALRHHLLYRAYLFGTPVFR